MELWIFVAVMVFVGIVWFNAVKNSGVVEAVSDDGFVMKTLLRTRRSIRWTDIARPVRRFERFVPRIVVHVASHQFGGLTSAYTVYLRGRSSEQEMIDKLQASVGVRIVRGLGD